MRNIHSLTNPPLEKQLSSLCDEWLSQFDDPIAVAQAAGWLLDLLQTELGPSITSRRVQAVRQLRLEGFTLAEIGAQLNLTRARIDTIAKS